MLSSFNVCTFTYGVSALLVFHPGLNTSRLWDEVTRCTCVLGGFVGVLCSTAVVVGYALSMTRETFVCLTYTDDTNVGIYLRLHPLTAHCVPLPLLCSFWYHRKGNSVPLFYGCCTVCMVLHAVGLDW
jgi:hypothetical protein